MHAVSAILMLETLPERNRHEHSAVLKPSESARARTVTSVDAMPMARSKLGVALRCSHLRGEFERM